VTAVANPWPERRILGYAHQGGAREAPSSTLYAFRQALAAGATGLEMDVHATADGQLVVCHDSTVDRTTNSTGRICALTLDELRRLDNAYWFVPGEVAAKGRPDEDYPLRGRAPEDPELRIATLREVLEAFEGVFLNLDIKQTAPNVTPYEEPLARLLADFGRTDDVIVASFTDAATEAFSALSPAVSTSAGMGGAGSFFAAVRNHSAPPATRHHAIQVPTRFGLTVIVDEDFVVLAHENSLAVHVWTIDEPEDMNRLVDLGVDGIMSDRPSVLSEVLARRGVAYRPA
jgi:glycerophosphoryl diester phosphodiesterase